MKFLNFNKLKYKTQQKAPNSFSNNMETLNVLRSSYIVKAVRFQLHFLHKYGHIFYRKNETDYWQIYLIWIPNDSLGLVCKHY